MTTELLLQVLRRCEVVGVSVSFAWRMVNVANNMLRNDINAQNVGNGQALLLYKT